MPCASSSPSLNEEAKPRDLPNTHTVASNRPAAAAAVQHYWSDRATHPPKGNMSGSAAKHEPSSSSSSGNGNGNGSSRPAAGRSGGYRGSSSGVDGRGRGGGRGRGRGGGETIIIGSSTTATATRSGCRGRRAQTGVQEAVEGGGVTITARTRVAAAEPPTAAVGASATSTTSSATAAALTVEAAALRLAWCPAAASPVTATSKTTTPEGTPVALQRRHHVHVHRCRRRRRHHHICHRRHRRRRRTRRHCPPEVPAAAAATSVRPLSPLPPCSSPNTGMTVAVGRSDVEAMPATPAVAVAAAEAGALRVGTGMKRGGTAVAASAPTRAQRRLAVVASPASRLARAREELEMPMATRRASWRAARPSRRCGTSRLTRVCLCA